MVEEQILDETFWAGRLPEAISVRIRRGGREAPLVGLVHISRTGDRPVDLVVGRDAWQREILLRAPVSPFLGAHMPIALAADLVLLKLYAGGLQDAWDIQQLLASDATATCGRSWSMTSRRSAPGDRRPAWALCSSC